MFPAVLFTIFIFSLAGTVTGNIVRANRSPITLPMSRRVNFTSIHNLLRHDQTRAKLLKAQGAAKASGLNTRAVINSKADNQVISYFASIGIGIPATFYSLLVDTGSSNILIDISSTKPYVRTGTSVATSNTVSIEFGSTSFFGNEFFDTVTITPSLIVRNQAIGVASTTSTGFGPGIDGILGLGPTDLTLGTLSPATNTLVPTIVDNAFAQGLITADEISIAFKPTNVSESLNGVLTWGGTDSTNFIPPISFSPITTVSPANEFWGIGLSIRYGASTTILAQTAGIIDSGTTLILIATNAFNAYKTATGATSDRTTGLLKLTPTQFANLKSLFFQTTSGGIFELTANGQIWPRTLNTDIGGTTSGIYLIVADIGTPSGSGLDFILGVTFMERFYVVLDTAGKRVGLASTSSTHAIVN
ncbi:aspartic peptidase A1 [Phlegmacium glaucopus]|nr:aspartic peptidase A1 [Phlegmacium glaucopus]